MSATIALQIIETEIENLRKENESLRDKNQKLKRELLVTQREITFLRAVAKDLKVKDVGDGGSFIVILRGER